MGAARGAGLVQELELDVLLHAWESVVAVGALGDLRHADGASRVGGLVGAVSAAATGGGGGSGGGWATGCEIELGNLDVG